MSSYRALCCDCLRGPIFPTAEEQQRAHSEEIACVCGSLQMCACGDCLWTLEQLEAGSRDPAALGMQAGVTLEGWTAEGGV